jgi:hypothetical protein
VSFFENLADAAGQAASGDFEGAAESAGAAVEDAADAVAEAVSDATGAVTGEDGAGEGAGAAWDNATETLRRGQEIGTRGAEATWDTTKGTLEWGRGAADRAFETAKDAPGELRDGAEEFGRNLMDASQTVDGTLLHVDTGTAGEIDVRMTGELGFGRGVDLDVSARVSTDLAGGHVLHAGATVDGDVDADPSGADVDYGAGASIGADDKTLAELDVKTHAGAHVAPAEADPPAEPEPDEKGFHLDPEPEPDPFADERGYDERSAGDDPDDDRDDGSDFDDLDD